MDSLDAKTLALVRIGAAVCEGSSDDVYPELVEEALAAGASKEDVLGAFLSVAALAGEPRVVAAASRIARALGYDVEAEFEYG